MTRSGVKIVSLWSKHVRFSAPLWVTLGVLGSLLLREVALNGMSANTISSKVGRHSTSTRPDLTGKVDSCTAPCDRGQRIGGECISKSEYGKYFHDPCNSCGTRRLEVFSRYRGREGIASSGLGKRERHRLTCLILPILLDVVLAERQRLPPASENSVKISHSPLVRPLRVLAFAPYGGDEAFLHITTEASARFSHYPVDYVPADNSPSVAKTLDGFEVDASQILFPSSFFDVVIFSHVLEHVPDMNRVLQEISRVLSPSGFAILTSPVGKQYRTYENASCVSEECRLREFGQEDHVRRIGREYVDLAARHFGTVFNGSFLQLVEKHFPYLPRVFKNNEYREQRDLFLFGYKSAVPSDSVHRFLQVPV
jgi:SAM-dependent methyltransferase